MWRRFDKDQIGAGSKTWIGGLYERFFAENERTTLSSEGGARVADVDVSIKCGFLCAP
jgi:hypothetical protein